MKTMLSVCALLASAAAIPPARAADVLSYYRFTGACVDCTGTGVGTLTLRNYDPAAMPDLAQGNFVEFTYASDMLPGVDVTAVSTLSGSLAGGDGAKTVAFQASDNSYVFQSSTSGFWQIAAGDMVLDFGLDHLWAPATGPVAAVPDAPAWATMVAGFLLAGAALRARRRPAVRFA